MNEILQLDTHATLFSYTQHVFYALHYIYEELKLCTNCDRYKANIVARLLYTIARFVHM
jgi:hypothetical protein